MQCLQNLKDKEVYVNIEGTVLKICHSREKSTIEEGKRSAGESRKPTRVKSDIGVQSNWGEGRFKGAESFEDRPWKCLLNPLLGPLCQLLIDGGVRPTRLDPDLTDAHSHRAGILHRIHSGFRQITRTRPNHPHSERTPSEDVFEQQSCICFQSSASCFACNKCKRRTCVCPCPCPKPKPPKTKCVKAICVPKPVYVYPPICQPKPPCPKPICLPKPPKPKKPICPPTQNKCFKCKCPAEKKPRCMKCKQTVCRCYRRKLKRFVRDSSKKCICEHDNLDCGAQKTSDTCKKSSKDSVKPSPSPSSDSMKCKTCRKKTCICITVDLPTFKACSGCNKNICECLPKFCNKCIGSCRCKRKHDSVSGSIVGCMKCKALFKLCCCCFRKKKKSKCPEIVVESVHETTDVCPTKQRSKELMNKISSTFGANKCTPCAEVCRTASVCPREKSRYKTKRFVRSKCKISPSCTKCSKFCFKKSKVQKGKCCKKTCKMCRRPCKKCDENSFERCPICAEKVNKRCSKCKRKCCRKCMKLRKKALKRKVRFGECNPNITPSPSMYGCPCSQSDVCVSQAFLGDEKPLSECKSSMIVNMARTSHPPSFICNTCFHYTANDTRYREQSGLRLSAQLGSTVYDKSFSDILDTSDESSSESSNYTLSSIRCLSELSFYTDKLKGRTQSRSMKKSEETVNSGRTELEQTVSECHYFKERVDDKVSLYGFKNLEKNSANKIVFQTYKSFSLPNLDMDEKWVHGEFVDMSDNPWMEGTVAQTNRTDGIAHRKTNPDRNRSRRGSVSGCALLGLLKKKGRTIFIKPNMAPPTNGFRALFGQKK